MNLPGRFFLTVLFGLPIPAGQFLTDYTRDPEVLFLKTLSQKTSHGIATFDTKNHWIKFEALADGVVLTVDVHQAANLDTRLGLPEVVGSLTYYLTSTGDSVSRILPINGRQGTTVSLDTYDRAFLHYHYVFSY